MQFDAVFFDVSGTLVRETPDEYVCIAQWIRDLGYAVDEKCEAQMTARMKNASYAQLAAEVAGAKRMDDDAFLAMMLDAAMRDVVPKEKQADALRDAGRIPWQQKRMEPMKGVFETLDALRARGIRLGVVSNHKKTLPDFLAQLGLAAYFEKIVVSEIVGLEKPDPAIMQYAMREMGMKDAAKCLYVGDHPFDVLCAKKAGMRCAWLANEAETLPESFACREDYRIAELRALTAL